jgi:hypothetical protein
MHITFRRPILLAKVSLGNGYPSSVCNSGFQPLHFIYAAAFSTADALLSSISDVPLKGLAIGNGWIDPKSHYMSYLDYSVKVGILEEQSPVRGHWDSSAK